MSKTRSYWCQKNTHNLCAYKDKSNPQDYCDCECHPNKEEKKMYYKVLTNGNSIYMNYAWPLPHDNKPGAWLTIDEDPVLCKRGFHGYNTLESALKEVDRRKEGKIYEMELAGIIVSDEEKSASNVARLLRLTPEFEPEITWHGILLCKVCDKPHNEVKLARIGIISWDADNHEYDPESWLKFEAREKDPTIRVAAAKSIERYAHFINAPLPVGTSYMPVAPAYHAFKPWKKEENSAILKCASCGLPVGLHDGWEKREEFQNKFTHYDRWDLILYIQTLEEG